MTVIKYICLGIVQGLTEFFPVSSSAHLLIFQELLQVKENQILLNIVLHFGTLLALIVFFYKDIKKILNKQILIYICLDSVLTTAIVLAGQDFFESMFLSSRTLALPLLATGAILICTKKFSQGQRTIANLNVRDAFWLGIVQGLAVTPGLSRSGITISTLLFRNVERRTAFQFSFLVSILAILGAMLFELDNFSAVSLSEFKYMIFGLVCSFLSGLLALKILFAIIQRAQLHFFGYYCLGLALIIWLLQ